MQKSIFKITKFIVLIGVILIIFAVPVLATDNVVSEENLEEQSDGTSSEEAYDEETENTLSPEHSEDVYSTEGAEQEENTENTSTSSNESIPTKKINSYSTISTLPEANLGLNNILNVILIAIGIILILLAIAILIRLK